MNTGQIRTEPAEVSQGHWSSVQAGLGFYTDLAHRPDICHRLLSFLRTSRGWLGLRKHPPGKFVSQNFFIREKDYRVIRCPDWCFTVLCQVLFEYVWVSRSAAEKPGRPGRHDLRSQHQPEPRPGSRLARETSKAKQSHRHQRFLGEAQQVRFCWFLTKQVRGGEVTANTSNWSSSNSRWENPVFPAPTSRPCFVSLGG